MSNIKPILIIFSLLFLITNCQKKLKSEKNCTIKSVSDTYRFPITSNSPEWKEFTTIEQVIDACQVPDSILHKMSTAGLIETILTNPAYYNDFGILNPQYEITSLQETFGEIKTLFERDDASIELLKRYNYMDPACEENNWTSLGEMGLNTNYSFRNMELLIGQKTALEQIIDDNKTKITSQLIVDKYEDKLESSQGIGFSMLILGRIMYLDNYSPFINVYNENSCLRDYLKFAAVNSLNCNCSEVHSVILSYSKEFINE